MYINKAYLYKFFNASINYLEALCTVIVEKVYPKIMSKSTYNSFFYYVKSYYVNESK